MNSSPIPHQQTLIPGRRILREVLLAYQPYRARMAQHAPRVLIVRFTAADPQPSTWSTRMRASAISAEQKTLTFSALGARVDNLVLPDTVSRAQFVKHLEQANADPDTVAIIVQTPPPARLVGELDRINPAKDLDALGVDSPRTACATADGIGRVVAPFLTEPDTTVAVVGSHGFVGRGVVAVLAEHDHHPLQLDAGDDLRQLREVDIVVSTTGQAGLLTAEHLHAGHRLVVDSGFTPQPGGPVGDVHPDAAQLPQAITPVPGGVGPIEMAVLSERLTSAEVAPELASWRYLGPDHELGAELTSVRDDVEHDLVADLDVGDNRRGAAGRDRARLEAEPDPPGLDLD